MPFRRRRGADARLCLARPYDSRAPIVVDNHAALSSGAKSIKSTRFFLAEKDRRKDLTDSRKGTILGAVTPAPDYADQLRAVDLRVTRPRLAVLEAVHAHPHADTESIFGAVRAGLPDVSRQAVYDVLAALTTAGLVRRIQPSGSVARYESRVGDNHHHVVCRSCGVIADVDCAVGEAPCLTPSDHDGALDGFVLDEAEVIYWGLCPDCSASQPSRSHT
jgi:Fur family transcriptional regulator, stress-responsive regulator